jgi:hypothetical protein
MCPGKLCMMTASLSGRLIVGTFNESYIIGQLDYFPWTSEHPKMGRFVKSQRASLLKVVGKWLDLGLKIKLPNLYLTNLRERRLLVPLLKATKYGNLLRVRNLCAEAWDRTLWEPDCHTSCWGLWIIGIVTVGWSLSMTSLGPYASFEKGYPSQSIRYDTIGKPGSADSPNEA